MTDTNIEDIAALQRQRDRTAINHKAILHTIEQTEMQLEEYRADERVARHILETFDAQLEQLKADRA